MNAITKPSNGAYNVIEHHILKRTDEISERARRTARRRSLLALMLFALATLAAAFEPWLGFALICSALVLHIKPDVGSGRAASDPLGTASDPGDPTASPPRT